MLVLSRTKGEKIQIGDDVTITVCEFRNTSGGLQVRIGIEAPREVAVHRGEVYDKIKQVEQREQRGETCPACGRTDLRWTCGVTECLCGYQSAGEPKD